MAVASETPETGTALTVEKRAEKSLDATNTRARLTRLVKSSQRIVEITNAAGREECHTALMALRDARTTITKAGKDARDDAVKFGKAVIAVEKELVEMVEPEEARLAAIRKAWDDARQAEKDRAEQLRREAVEAINRRFAEIRQAPLLAATKTVEEIDTMVDELAHLDVTTFPEDMRAAVVYEVNVATGGMLEARAKRVQKDMDDKQAELDRQELAKLRAEREQAQREQAERDEAVRVQAAEAAKLAQEWDDAHAEDRQRTQAIEDQRRRDELAEQEKRLADERRELARQQAEAKAREEAAAIAGASLLEAASDALALLVSLGQGESLVAKKLAAALKREPATTEA